MWSSYLSGTSRHLTLGVSLLSFSHDPLAAWALLVPISGAGPTAPGPAASWLPSDSGVPGPWHADYNAVGKRP